MSDPKKNVTINDLARECGVSATTVSLGLRNHPRISAETKDRIKEAAARMNYTRNPMISALMSNLSQSRGLSAPIPLAAVYANNLVHVEANQYHRNLWKGISRRAAELGFSIERFFLADQKMSSKRITQILMARGISGVIIPPGQRGGAHLSLDWNSFSSVAIGYSMLRPNLHRVCQDQYQGIRLALKQLYLYGYKRPGLVFYRIEDIRSLYLWSSGFYGYEYPNKKNDVIPVLECNEDEFFQWYETYKPDVIVSMGDSMSGLLEQAVLKCPGDVGFITLCQGTTEPAIAGVDQQEELVGAAAVEQLAQLLYCNRLGVPDVPSIVLIPPKWVDGPSLPRRSVSVKK